METPEQTQDSLMSESMYDSFSEQLVAHPQAAAALAAPVTSLASNPVGLLDFWGSQHFFPSHVASVGEAFEALDDQHWKSLSFTDLKDPAYTISGEQTIHWHIQYDVRKALESSEPLVSDSVAIGEHTWRLKLDPNGIALGYLSVFLECTTSPNSTASGEAHLAMPVLNGESMKPFHQVPAQFSIILYDDQRPKSLHFKHAKHAFSHFSPDRGFPRFLRHSSWQPTTTNSLSFVAHIRTYQDPTGCLFGDESFPALPLQVTDVFSKNGVCPLRDDQSPLGPVMPAVVSWLYLPAFRNILYGITNTRQRPIIHALHELLYLFRKPSWSGLRQLTSLSRATAYYGCAIGEAKDVYHVWNMLTQLLRVELSGTAQAEAFANLLCHKAFRIKTMKSLSATYVSESVKDLQARLDAQGHGCDYPILQVELPRQTYSKQLREWQYVTNSTKAPMKLVLGGHQYHLYGMILHDARLRSGQFSALISPNGSTFYKFKGGIAERQTLKQAMKDTRKAVYIVMYVRDDLSQRALPDHDWTPPEWLNEAYAEPYIKENGYAKGKSDMVGVQTNVTNEDDSDEMDDEDDEEDDDHDDHEDIDVDVYDSDDEDTPQPPATIVGHNNSDSGASIPPSVTSTATVATRDYAVEMQMANTLAQSNSSPEATWKYEEHPNHAHSIIEDYMNREYHEGMVEKGKYQGPGHHIYWSGDSYTGDFSDGLAHGFGTMLFHNGDVYQGEWKSGRFHGKGTLTSGRTKNTYNGGFKDGRRHGQGTTTWHTAEAGDDLCMICYTHEQSCAFYSCGHVCACLECAERLKTCPICKKRVIDVLRLYFTSKTI